MSIITITAHAGSLNAQRERYQQIKQAWDTNQIASVEQLMPGLRDYPLYPWLEYRLLTQNLQHENPLAVRQFMQRYPTLPPVRALESRFINELARRQDWQGILNFSPLEPKSVSARCNWNYAQWAAGQPQLAYRNAKIIWLRGTSLPAACDRLFSVWQKAGQQTPLTTLERIRLAMKEDNTRLVNFLAQQLPEHYQSIADAVVALQSDPSTVESFSRHMGPDNFTRQATRFALARVAHQDVEKARLMIPRLAHLQKMNVSGIQEMKEVVAGRLFGSDVTAEQARWRDRVIMGSGSGALFEHRLRLALSANDRHELPVWLARLPRAVKDKDEWRYWQADVLIERGNKTEGEQILRHLMQGRGFYPMVAAQRLGVKYPLQTDQTPVGEGEVQQEPELARVRELMYWDMHNLARSEWIRLVASKSSQQQQQLAGYALKQGWWDLSVQATVTAKLWNHLAERFPLAWQDQFERFRIGKAISVSYAMAIARQESGWNPQARSPVGAAGLMQIMPATATHTARMHSIASYSSSQLFDPQTNIQLGTQYLEYLYQQFGQKRIYATAAYNAGPGRVRNWQITSGSRLDPVAFIETIPFPETRQYVKNVLVYDAYYRHFMNQPDAVFSDYEWQQRY